MKRNLLTLALGLAFTAGAMAAAPVLQPGPLYLQFNNLEQAGPMLPGFAAKDLNGDGIADVGGLEFNWGVFNVSTIQAGAVATPNTEIGGGPAYFADFGLNQVSGIFYGFKLKDGTNNQLTGGYMDFWYHDTAATAITAAELAGGFAPGTRTDWNLAGKFTSGTFLGRVKFESGIIDGDNETTVKSSVDPLSFTGQGNADGFGSVVDINNDGVIDAADGLWAAPINGDWFFVDPNGNGTRGEAGEKRDLRFSTFFTNLDTWDAIDAGTGAPIQGLRSNDPARAFVVPEPSMIGLLGLGLLGLGLGRRRKA